MCSWITPGFILVLAHCGSHNKWRYISTWEQQVRMLPGKSTKRHKAGQKALVRAPAHLRPRVVKCSMYNTCSRLPNNQVSLHNVDRHLWQSVKIYRYLLGFSLATYLSFQYGKMPNIYKRREDSTINSHVSNIHLKKLSTHRKVSIVHPTSLYYLEANPRYPIILSINISAYISVKYKLFRNKIPLSNTIMTSKKLIIIP